MLVEDGETVTPGTPLFEMEEGEGGAAPAAAPKAEAPKVEAGKTIYFYML